MFVRLPQEVLVFVFGGVISGNMLFFFKESYRIKMDYIAKKEGDDVKPETEETIVIRVCDSVCFEWLSYDHLGR